MTDEHDQLKINESEWENSRNWRYGIFYYSQMDSRPWVPKRSMYGRRRFGGTPNFARKSARLYLMVIVGFMMLMFLVLVYLDKGGPPN